MNFSLPDSGETRVAVELAGQCLDLERARAGGSLRIGTGSLIEDVLRSPGGLASLEHQLTDRSVESMGSCALERDNLRLRAPVLHPSKVIGIGLNYHDHAEEVKMAKPSEPILFGMYPNTITGPETAIKIPKLSQKIDYEAELAIVIGRRGRYILEAQAVDFVAGYTVLNDVSARDLQMHDNQWIRGKSFDGFCPIGPCLVGTSELGDGDGLDIRTRLNGQTMQNSNTRNLIFKVPYLVSFISQVMTLEPGDIIATGTPGGVGFARTPPVWMKAGDVIEVEVSGIGILRNTIENEGEA